MKITNRRVPIAYIALLTAAMLLFTACGAPAGEVVSSASSQTVQQQTPAHAAMTEELKALLDADPELMALMEKSLAAAAAITPTRRRALTSCMIFWIGRPPVCRGTC